jgi:glutamate:GABA antiporter
MPCSWRRLAAPSPREGGPYEWTKLAFGRLQGAIAAVPYWVTNPLWVGGSLAFIATEAWSENLFNIGSGSAGDYIFKGLFIWLSIGVAIVSLRRGKWIPNVGAFLRVFVLGVFTVTTIIYAFNHGVSGFPIGDLKPTVAVFLALVPLLLFNMGASSCRTAPPKRWRTRGATCPWRSCAAPSRACCLCDPDLRDHPRATGR